MSHDVEGSVSCGHDSKVKVTRSNNIFFHVNVPPPKPLDRDISNFAGA